jgi:predicted DNA-binding transcriptional regulator YafY
MSRSERLFELLQLLRRHRRPVSGATIATELGISLRTLYRDIATLQSQGACINGAPGLGYVMTPGFTLPPLMFSAEEVEALVLGSRWVADRGDARLAAAARDALVKIAAVLPAELRHELDASGLIVGPGAPIAAGDAELATIRQAIRMEHKLAIRYRDGSGHDSSRTIWPFALGFFDRARVLIGWCELRQSIRHFRTDRIMDLTVTGGRYPRRRQALMKEWRELEGVPERARAAPRATAAGN